MENNTMMTKRIIYTDEFGKKIDINTIEGIHTIINDILAQYNTEISCLNVKKNIKASLEICYKKRIQEIGNIKQQETDIW